MSCFWVFIWLRPWLQYSKNVIYLSLYEDYVQSSQNGHSPHKMPYFLVVRTAIMITVLTKYLISESVFTELIASTSKTRSAKGRSQKKFQVLCPWPQEGGFPPLPTPTVTWTRRLTCKLLYVGVKVEGTTSSGAIRKGKIRNKNIQASGDWEESIYVTWMRM